MNIVTTVKQIKGKAIIVGSGIGGLSAALRLAHEGFSVTVLERQDSPGGKMRTLPSEAGPVDAGPTVLTLKPIFEELFNSVHENLDSHLPLIRQKILARHWWPDGSKLDLFDDYESSQKAIYEFSGLTGFREFQKFFRKTQRLFNAFEGSMIYAAAPTFWNMAKLVLTSPDLAKDIAPFRTLAKTLSKDFTDPRLAQLFGRYATYVGGSPYFSPTLLSLIWQAEAKGVWSIKGGMYSLIKKIEKLAKTRGAIFRYCCHVKNFLKNGEKIAGVELSSGEKIFADVVLFNGDPRSLSTGSLGSDYKKITANTLHTERSFSARVWSFAAQIKGDDLIRHNVFFAENARSEFEDLKSGRMPLEPTIYVCAQDRGLNAGYPEKERFEIILNAAPVNKAVPVTQEFQKCLKLTLKTLEKFGVIFTPSPDPKTLTTPNMFAKMFPASEGSLYGQSPHGIMSALRKPKTKTGLRGLYLVGGGVHPGAGIPMATLSAKHAVETILKDQILISKSPQMDTHGGTSMVSIKPQTAVFQSSDS